MADDLEWPRRGYRRGHLSKAPDEGAVSTSSNERVELAERDPSPGLHLAMQSGLSHEGRGGLPMWR